MKNFLLLVLFALSFIPSLMSQSVGDIAIIGIRGDATDQFTFVAINDIPANSAISFTDSGVLSDGTFRGGEGGVLWTSPATVVTAGTVVSVTVSNGGNSSFNVTSNIGTITNANDGEVGNNGMNISASGDQIIAFVGSSASPTFIAAAQINSTAWQTNSTASTNSALPPGLTDGLTAVAAGAGAGAGAEFDNAEYTGPRGNFADTNAALMAINDAANWTGNNTAFALNVTDFSPLLPVELSSFYLDKNNELVTVSWQTAQERNNSHFEIQHSTDNRTFTTIGKEEGAGDSDVKVDYSFTHETPANGVNYYRLQQFDFDGQSEYSQVVSVRFGKDSNISIYPNPVQSEVTIALGEEFATNATAEIISQNGSTVLRETFTAKSFTQTMNVNNLSAGVYILRVVSGNEVYTERFVKK